MSCLWDLFENFWYDRFPDSSSQSTHAMAHFSAFRGNKKFHIQKPVQYWKTALHAILPRRVARIPSPSSLLRFTYKKFRYEHHNYTRFIEQNYILSRHTFEETFYALNDQQCLLHYRFIKSDVLKLVPILFVCGETYLKSRKGTVLHYFPLHVSFWSVYRHILYDPLWRPFFRDIGEFLGRAWVPIRGEFTFHHWFSEFSLFFTRAQQDMQEQSRARTQLSKTASGTSTGPSWGLPAQRLTDFSLLFIVNINDTIHQKIKRSWLQMKCNARSGTFRATPAWLGVFLGLLSWRGALNVLEFERYCIYSDGGYSNRVFLFVPLKAGELKANQSLFSPTMASGLITVWVNF